MWIRSQEVDPWRAWHPGSLAEFLAGGETALANGKGQADPRDREIRELKKEVEGRDQVIGELTIANRILKKTADGSY